jgi:prepilin-type processing-associated H-X9-DG protein
MSPAPPPPFQPTSSRYPAVVIGCLSALPIVLLAVGWYFATPAVWSLGMVALVLDYFAVCVLSIYWGIIRRSRLLWLGSGLLALPAVIPLVLIGALLLPAIRGARAAGARSQCKDNLSRITLALVQYHDTFQSYPPRYIADANGRPMHSWRVLILPYLDQKSLYQQYRFDEPWDGPNNRKLHDISLKIFQCPSHGKTQPATETNYVGVVGPGTVWTDKSGGFVRMADIIDGTSNTIVLVEVENSGIHWMEPRDLHVVQMPMAINPKSGQGISSNHPGGVNVGFADGSVRFLTSGTPAETIRAALTRNGKEPPPKEPEQ